MPHPDQIKKGDLGRILAENRDAPRRRSATSVKPRRPSHGPTHWSFLWERARQYMSALAHIQGALRSLPEAQARAKAAATIRTFRQHASRTHFPNRRGFGTDHETGYWYLVLFHRADPLPLLRDGSPFFNGVSLVAAQYGLRTGSVLGTAGYRRRGRRGPDPLRFQPKDSCFRLGCTDSGPLKSFLICPECARRLREAGLLR